MSDELKGKKSGLTEFFEGLNGLIDLVSKLEEHRTIDKSGNFKTDSGLSGVYGVHIKTASGGTPIFEQFGNIRQGNKGAVLKDEREPIVDLFEGEDTLTVVAELPGVTEESISIEVEGKTLTLKAKAKDRKYHKQLPLPYEVKAEPQKRSFINGVFSIDLVKAVDPAVKA